MLRYHDLGPQQPAVHRYSAGASGLREVSPCLLCQEGPMLRPRKT